MSVAAIYARVSSARQKEAQTIASQTAALREYAAATGLEIPPDWVFEDDGYSGATLIRPALERLRDLAAEIEIPVVLCYAPDRLARRYAYQALLLDEFARVGSEVRFLKGPKAATPEDELLLQFQGMIAEYERAQIAERTRRGKLHRARTGALAVLSAAPYGYRYVRKADGGDARYEIVESEAAVVRALFRQYVDEPVSIGALARWLMQQGIPSPAGSTHWRRSTVGRILRQPAYGGRAAFGKTQNTAAPPRLTRTGRLRGQKRGRRPAVRRRPRSEWVDIPVPAIVSESMCAEVARRLEANKHFAARRTKVPSLLQGLAICEGCGYSYSRSSAKTTRGMLYYYRCLGSDNWRFPHGRVCHNRPVRQDALDRVVWAHVSGLLADPALLQAELARRLDALRAANPDTAQRARLESELNRVTTARGRLLEAYQHELLSLEELRGRMPELRQKEAGLRAQLDMLVAHAVDRETYLTLAETLESFRARLHQAIDTASIQERQRVLRLVVKEVVVGPDRLLIRHSIPTPTPDGAPHYRLCPRGLVADAGEAQCVVRAAAQQLLRERAKHPPAARLLRGKTAEIRVELIGAEVAFQTTRFISEGSCQERRRHDVTGGFRVPHRAKTRRKEIGNQENFASIDTRTVRSKIPLKFPVTPDVSRRYERAPPPPSELGNARANQAICRGHSAPPLWHARCSGGVSAIVLARGIPRLTPEGGSTYDPHHPVGRRRSPDRWGCQPNDVHGEGHCRPRDPGHRRSWLRRTCHPPLFGVRASGGGDLHLDGSPGGEAHLRRRSTDGLQQVGASHQPLRFKLRSASAARQSLRDVLLLYARKRNVRRLH
jgi:site-specific DNA recombinase